MKYLSPIVNKGFAGALSAFTVVKGQLYSYPSLFNDRKLRLTEAKPQSTTVSGDRALESSDYLNVLL